MSNPVPQGGDARPAPLLTAIAPCYNECLCLEELVVRLDAALRTVAERYEILIVENGSHDDSWQVLQRLSARFPALRVLRLSRNYGYQGAIEAGLQHARGRWVAVIDGDLQDPPELIADLWRKAQEGFDVVYGVRKKRQEGMWLVLMYRLYYRLMARMSSVRMPLDASEFCIMSPRAVAALRRLTEANRSQRSLRAWIGFRQTGIDYERDRRFAGETKFSLLGYFSFAIESIVAFSAIPLRVISMSGILMSLASILGAAVYLVGKATGAISFPACLATLYFIVPLFFGITMAAIGVVGEYVGRIYEEVKRRPNFIVSEELPEVDS